MYVYQKIRNGVPFTKPILFSLVTSSMVSGSLMLAASGKRSCWKSKPEIEYERPVRVVLFGCTGPSEYSSTCKSSSESLDDRDNGGEGYTFGFVDELME